MKRIFVTAAVVMAIAACGGSATDNKEKGADEKKTEAAPANDLSSNPDYSKGLALVAGNDCLTCHKVDEKLNGPSYRDVANKYENNDENVKMLAGKIISGGSGVWGEVMMTPHAAVTQADAEQMVKYILLLKNK